MIRGTAYRFSPHGAIEDYAKCNSDYDYGQNMKETVAQRRFRKKTPGRLADANENG